MARPIEFTEEIQDKVISSIRGGSSIRDAMNAVGFCYDTYNDWYNKSPEFRAKVDAADKEQLQNMKLAARMKLYENVLAGNQRAIEMVLRALEPEIWEKKELKQEVPPVQVVLGSKEEMYAAFFEALKSSDPDQTKAAALKLKGGGNNGAHA
jgi:hypothetical protein